jgi:hypothetical protein
MQKLLTTRTFGLVFALLIATVGLAVARNLGIPTDPGEDRTWYLRIALDQYVRPPFVWRIGIAEIAQRWPLGLHEGFRFFHILSMLMIAVCALEIVRDRYPNRPSLPWVAVGLLFSVPVFSQHLPEDIYRVDLPSMAVMFGCGLAFVKRQWVPLVVLAMLGGAVRETSVLMACALCFALRPSYAAFLPIVGIASYIAIRMSNQIPYSPNFAEVIRYRIDNFALGEAVRQYILGPTGLAILACLPAILVKRVLRRPTSGEGAFGVVSLVPLVLVALLQILSGSDTARLLLPMSVAIWLAVIHWVSEWIEQPRGLALAGSLAVIGAAIPIGHLPYKIAIPLIAGWLVAFLFFNPELKPPGDGPTTPSEPSSPLPA